MLLWEFHSCFDLSWQWQQVVIVTERWPFLFPGIHYCFFVLFCFFRFLCVMKSPPSYIFGESSHFPWCIPPTLSFSQCNSLLHTHLKKQKKTKHMGPSHPSLHLATQKWTGQASRPPLCFIVVAALLLVSLQWSAGYSLNLWLLHNLWQHRSQRHWMSLSVVITLLQGRIED